MVEADVINRVLSADVLTLVAVLLIVVGGVLTFMARGMLKQNSSTGDLSMRLLSLNEKNLSALDKLGVALDANTAYIKGTRDAQEAESKGVIKSLEDVADVLGYIKRGLHMMNETGNRTVAGIARIEKDNAMTADKLDSLMLTVTANASKLEEVAGVLGQLPTGITVAIERGLSGWVKSTIRDEVESILNEREAKKDETGEVVVVGGGADGGAIVGDGAGTSADVRDGDSGGGGGGDGSGSPACGNADGGGDNP